MTLDAFRSIYRFDKNNHVCYVCIKAFRSSRCEWVSKRHVACPFRSGAKIYLYRDIHIDIYTYTMRIAIIAKVSLCICITFLIFKIITYVPGLFFTKIYANTYMHINHIICYIYIYIYIHLFCFLF